MAAPGIYTSVKVEIQWIAGQWTDVSSLVALEAGVKITQGRATEADDSTPGTCTFTLRNDDGRFTPNNPLSSFFPEIVENTPVRVSVIKSATTYRRFTGFITSLEPSFPDNDSATGEVAVSCTDVMANLARRLTNSEYMEQSRRQAFDLSPFYPAWFDTWSFTGVARGGLRFPNLGAMSSATAHFGTAIMIPCTDGSYSLESTDSELLDGAISFAPRIKTAKGPIMRIIPQTNPNVISFWFKCPQSTTFTAGYFTIAQGFKNSTLAWEIRLFLSSSTVTLGLYDPTVLVTTPLQIIDSLANSDANSINDDAWHKVTLIDIGGIGTQLGASLDDNGPNVALNVFTVEDTTRMYFGGSVVAPSLERKMTHCGTVSIAGICIAGGGLSTQQGNIPRAYAVPGVTTCSSTSRYLELCEMAPTLVGATLRSVGATNASTALTSSSQFSGNDVGAGVGLNALPSYPQSATITAVTNPSSATMSATYPGTTGTNPTLIGPVTIGTDNRIVARVNTLDSGNLAEAFNTLARSVGGCMWVNPSGFLTLIMPDAMRSLTPLATVDIEGDIEASALTLRRAVDTVPTRVTINGPVGDITNIDAVAETTYARKETTITAGAGTAEDAYGLTGYYLTSSRGLRVASVATDLVTAAADLYATFMNGALRPGVRLRASGLPTAIFGVSRTDVLVQGWTEEYDAVSALFTFDLIPADDPVEGTFDDAEYGRWAADSSKCLGYPVTSGGTSIVVAATATGGTALTTSAGDYPLDLDIYGERVTAAGVPGTLARTNLCTNPSFEVNTTGWSVFLSATIARTTLVPGVDGLSSGQATWPTASVSNTAVGYPTAVTSGQTYTFSVYAYVPLGNPRVQVAELSGLGSSVSFVRRDTTGFNDGWVRLDMTLTAAATTTYTFIVRTFDASTAGQVAFIDAAMVENTTLGVGSYFDGSNGGAWTGTADASTSTQSTQTLTVTRGVSPTVARAHIAGELVDAYHSMAFTI
jgi:hypothetical protein